jgi:UDP-N-acetylmuramoyl-L-alanyl-D-glutamate--2,6-diaminopimelate ligase
MAKIACKMSDKIILTSDNPRTENPQTSLDEMNEGVEPQDKSRVLTIVNREEAIRTACMLARSGDIILVAGKGHEKYQDINGVRHHFDDKEKLVNELRIVIPNEERELLNKSVKQILRSAQDDNHN